MYAHELFEAGKPNIVVTYPGRFQPFHQGHAGVFQQLQKQFGRDSVYVLTSNDQSSAKSPFNFSDKYQLITAAGVPGDRIIETNKMYALPEGMDPTNTIFITAVGAPDANRLSPDTFLKKDRKDSAGNIIKQAGSPSYYKTWGGVEEPVTADQHGYVIVIPEIKKNVTLNGQTYDVSHGTECRNLWNQVRNDKKASDEFLKALYGKATPEIRHIFDKIPDPQNEDVEMDTVAEDASGYIPKNKKEANDPRWSNALTVDVHPDTLNKNLKAFNLTEFAPDEGGGSRKFIPWPEFIEQVKQIVGKDFECVENVVKSTIKARFVPHDPMEYGPTMLYSYYETRAGGRNKGAVSTRGSIQVGKYYPNTSGLGDRNFITQFSLLKGHPFERHFDLTFDNIYKIANIIQGNTQGAYQMPQQNVAEETTKCPPATQDITLNLKNRQKAINEYGYGPLNPDLPNTKFWMKKVDEWNLDSVDEAKQSLCGNCAAFDQRQDTLDCIAKGIDADNPGDAEATIDAGDLGYCKFLKFKCASRRTCDAWVTGGPLTDKQEIDEDFGDFDRAVKMIKEAAPTINYGIGKNPGKLVKVGKGGKVPHAKMHLNVGTATAKKLGLPHNVNESKEGSEPDFPELLKEFLPLAMKNLKLKNLPKINLEKHIETHDGQATFGRYVNGENVIHLAIADRHPLDILRTLAHELCHYKQDTLKELTTGSGRTGSPEENQAHVMAGIIMRHFNKAHPELIKLNPIEMK